ncbi:MAG: aminotransferase class I/II-fold pyridoxal phosphate-dependent enzyme, partial [Demequinaceae bacterium]|nr:aminotransferase class I/II-fold pyridoxal phosphate-dependent enzyme [Demequinaceae bacterium]
MPYDFSLPTDRRRTNSLKWDVEEFELPMWVADMDFRTAPAVVDALRAKVDAGVFGYTIVPPQYALAVRSWWARRHDFTIDEEWVTFATGVVPALSSVVRAMTAVGDAIVIQQPVYDIFTHSIVNNGRTVVSNDLVRDESGYRMDVDDLERRLADPRTTAMILCNPHNPVGRLWTRDELTTVARLAARHGVLVIADEVHGDLTAPGSRYIPFASVCAEAQANSI